MSARLTDLSGTLTSLQLSRRDDPMRSKQ